MSYKDIVLKAIINSSEKMLKVRPTYNEIGDEKSPIRVEDFTIIMGIAGKVSGQLIFGFKEEVVKKIAEIMIEQNVESLDELAVSAVAEFTNVLSGNSTIDIVKSGINKKIGMSPPSIVQGKNMRISTKVLPIEKIVLDFGSTIGEVVLHIALKEKE